MPQHTPLAETLANHDYLFTPGVFHALDARIAEYAGHQAVYMSGGATNKGIYGIPDGHIGMAEMVENARRITSVVDIPVIADADTGYGEEGHIRRTIREYVKTGVVGIHIEDQQYPKSCGQSDDKIVVSRDLAEARLETARREAAALNSNLLVIPRIDAFDASNGGWNEGVERARMFADLNFDVVFPEMHQPTPDDVVRFASEIHETHPEARFLFNYNAAHQWSDDPDALTFEELGAMGFQLIIAPLAGLYAGAHAVFDHFSRLADDGHKAQFHMEQRWENHGPFDSISDALTGMGENNFFEF